MSEVVIPYILTLTIPNAPIQQHLECESFAHGSALISKALETGVIEHQRGAGNALLSPALIVIMLCPGTTFMLMPKPEFERMVAQARFGAPAGGIVGRG